MDELDKRMDGWIRVPEDAARRGGNSFIFMHFNNLGGTRQYSRRPYTQTYYAARAFTHYYTIS